MGRYPIDRKERVTLGGLGQTIHIWGTKNENPVILFLHGGPGVPNRHDMAKDGFGLTDDFTVVAWDQRGTGGSYFGCDPESLTLEQLISDCAELISWLCKTLDKEKIFIYLVPIRILVNGKNKNLNFIGLLIIYGKEHIPYQNHLHLLNTNLCV